MIFLYFILTTVLAYKAENVTYYPPEMANLSYNVSEFVVGEQSCVSLKIGYGFFERILKEIGRQSVQRYNLHNFHKSTNNYVLIKKSVSQQLTRMSDNGLYMEYTYEMEDKQQRFNFTGKMRLFVILEKDGDGVPQFQLSRKYEEYMYPETDISKFECRLGHTEKERQDLCWK